MKFADQNQPFVTISTLWKEDDTTARPSPARPSWMHGLIGHRSFLFLLSRLYFPLNLPHNSSQKSDRSILHAKKVSRVCLRFIQQKPIVGLADRESRIAISSSQSSISAKWTFRGFLGDASLLLHGKDETTTARPGRVECMD
jgi:hypothetical protein